MHAVIGTYAKGYYPLWYNERKVLEGLALRLYAGNFLEEARDLTLKDLWGRFVRLEELNQRSSHKAMHIILAIPPEAELSSERLTAIAKDYLDMMRLGRQPYVVYRHMDTATTHLHVVVSKIVPPEGRLVEFPSTPNRLSRAVIKELVETYGLKKPGMVRDTEMRPAENDAKRIVYGKKPSTKAISDVLAYVLPRYAYTSVDELNSILMQYYVFADTGKPDSFLARKRGLVYQIHDANGKYKGGRIPASRLPSKPGRAWLEKAYEQNALRRGKELPAFRNRIELVVRARPAEWAGFVRLLGKERIHVSAFMNEKGLVHELAFVDHERKIAVTAAGLGGELTAERIFERLGYRRDYGLAPTREPGIEDRRLLPAHQFRAVQYLSQQKKQELGHTLKIKQSL